MSTNPRSLGKYELHERLGRGGMAEVWKAFDPQLKRYVAIKFVQANLRADPTFTTRFIREAQAVASLRHPNIVRIYDFESSTSESDDSLAYMVMDYIEGQTLADYIHSTSLVHKFPSASEIVHLFTPIGSAIDYAHQRGMIHRDIKPANILLDQHNTTRNPMGEPILSDFGIVKILGTATGTLTSSSVGTPLYISPEQAKGQPGNEASDLYALGVTLYEVCTGVPPFQGESPFAILNQHITTPPPSPRLINPALPPALEAVILRCLAKEPEERFPSASALISALAQTLEPPVYSLDTLSSTNQATYYKPLQGNPVQASPPAQVDNVNTPVLPAETEPTLLKTPRSSNPPTPPLQVPAAEPSPSLAQTPAASVPPLQEAPAKSEETTRGTPTIPRRQRRGLYAALIALLLIVLGGSVLGAFFVFSARPHSPSQAPATTTGIVGHGFFSSSGQSSGSNSLGINDTFQVRLSNISNPAPGNSYYAWLLPDNNQSEALSVGLGPLNVTNGIASLSSPYVDPQHTNLVGSFSRLLVTEEATSPPPQSFSLDKKMWRYYAEIPQTPASTNCISLLTQLSDLCHIRHLLSNDPEVKKVGLPSGLNYWLVNNTEEVQKWAREAVDHNDPAYIRHKIINILYLLDGLGCIQQDLQHASSAPGTDNTPDDGTLPKIAAIPLLDCALAPSLPSYLIHIHNHLSAIIQAPGVLADQTALATQINTELNNIRALLSQVHADAQRLVAMGNTQLTQTSGLNLRTQIDSLATSILSGGNNPATGEPEPGIARISDQIQQLATFDIKAYTTQ